jgi:hypothetical protein
VHNKPAPSRLLVADVCERFTELVSVAILAQYKVKAWMPPCFTITCESVELFGLPGFGRWIKHSFITKVSENDRLPLPLLPLVLFLSKHAFIEHSLTNLFIFFLSSHSKSWYSP